jgi:hypothetical protein
MGRDGWREGGRMEVGEGEGEREEREERGHTGRWGKQTLRYCTALKSQGPSDQERKCVVRAAECRESEISGDTLGYCRLFPNAAEAPLADRILGPWCLPLGSKNR